MTLRITVWMKRILNGKGNAKIHLHIKQEIVLSGLVLMKVAETHVKETVVDGLLLKILEYPLWRI